MSGLAMALGGPAVELAAQQVAPGLPPATVARVDSIATAFVAARALPGLAVVLIDGGRIVAERDYGVGDRATGTPIGPRTLFQVGSVTKGFTASLIGRLVAEGRVDTAATVGRYVRGLAPAVAGLRIADLLRHTAGLADAAGGDGEHAPRRLADVARTLGDTVVILPAGTAFSYSNLGYTLLGAVAEEVTGLDFGAALQRFVLRPFGAGPAVMGTAFPPGMTRAVGHRAGSDGALVPVDPPSDDTRLHPAGYLAITPRGAATLLVALLNDGRIAGKQVLPAAWVRRATAPQIAVPGMPAGAAYGFGVFSDSGGGRVNLWHPGLIDGSVALYVGVPKTRSGVVLLTNRDGVRLEGLAADLLAALPANRTVPVPTPVTATTAPQAPSEDPAGLVGTYRGRYDISLSLEGERLMLGRFGTTAPLTSLGNGRWSFEATPGRREVIRIHPAVAGRTPAYLEAGLWAFVRR